MAAWTKEQAAAMQLKSAAALKARTAAKLARAAGEAALIEAGLKRKEEEALIPVFFPERLAAQVGSGSGMPCFVQGDNLFSLQGKYIGKAPQHLEYWPTEEQEAINRRTKARQRQALNRVPQRGGDAPLPKSTLDAQRENARALAAETLAE